MIKAKIGWNGDLQDKTFKDEMSALEFCRKHYDKIDHINFHYTNNEPVPHFLIMDYLREDNR